MLGFVFARPIVRSILLLSLFVFIFHKVVCRFRFHRRLYIPFVRCVKFPLTFLYNVHLQFTTRVYKITKYYYKFMNGIFNPNHILTDWQSSSLAIDESNIVCFWQYFCAVVASKKPYRMTHRGDYIIEPLRNLYKYLSDKNVNPYDQSSVRILYNII